MRRVNTASPVAAQVSMLCPHFERARFICIRWAVRHTFAILSGHTWRYTSTVPGSFRRWRLPSPSMGEGLGEGDVTFPPPSNSLPSGEGGQHFISPSPHSGFRLTAMTLGCLCEQREMTKW